MLVTLFGKVSADYTISGALTERGRERLVDRMTTPEGRKAFLEALEEQPSLANALDSRGNSALYQASAAGDTQAMARIIDAGADRGFFRDAIFAAAQNAQQAALDLLVARGGAVEQHYHIHRLGDIAYAETQEGQKCRQGIKMLVAIRDAGKRGLSGGDAPAPAKAASSRPCPLHL